jgi:hypothetical protein
LLHGAASEIRLNSRDNQLDFRLKGISPVILGSSTRMEFASNDKHQLSYPTRDSYLKMRSQLNIGYAKE